MLSWAMPLDVERALEVLLNTLYRTICKGCLPAVQTTEYVDFRTRLAPLAVADSQSEPVEHFPFDQVLLRPLSSRSRAAAEAGTTTKGGRGDGTSRSPPGSGDLLKDVVIEYCAQGMSQTYVAKFGQESGVELLQLFFSDQPTPLYALDVLVSVGNLIVYQRSLTESAFARYVRHRRSGQSQKESADNSTAQGECLRVPIGGVTDCEEMTVRLMYTHASTSLGTAGKAPVLPETVAEFYGAPKSEDGQAAAQAGYMKLVKEFEQQPAVLRAVGDSVRMLTAPLGAKPGWTRMLPFLVESTPTVSEGAQEKGA